MALEKPTRGKQVRERESILFLQDKNQKYFYSNKPTYLNPENDPADCLGFCAFATSISVQILIGIVPKILATFSLNFCAEK